MDLKKLDLVELNAQEVKETEGGFLPIITLAGLAFCAAAWIGIAGSAQQGYNAGKKDK